MTAAGDFEEVIQGRERLREVVEPPSRYVANKVIDHLDEMCRRFIAAAPFAVIASTSTAGAVDLSPKGDPPGFVAVLDDQCLAIPDRPGNNRADTMENLLEDSRIGLIFLVPGKRETLRISGRAMIVRDTALNARLACNGHEPSLALVVTVERAFFHCSKCMIRSGLWQPEGWADPAGLPTLAETMKWHGRLPDEIEEIERIIDRNAKTRLY